MERLKDAWGVPEEFKERTLSNVEITAENKDIYKKVEKYIETLPDNIACGDGITFVGRAGTGKTMFASIIQNEAAKKGFSTIQIDSQTLCDRANDDDFIGNLINVDLLIIDDVGGEAKNALWNARMNQIIRQRYSYKKPTILTLSFFYEELAERTTQGVEDRLSERNILLELHGRSFRKKKKGLPQQKGEKSSRIADEILKQARKETIFEEGSIEYKLADLLRKKILENNEFAKVPKDLNAWCDEVRKMIKIDKRNPKEIAQVIVWCQKHPFWRSNILSTKKLREKYDSLVLQMKGGR